MESSHERLRRTREARGYKSASEAARAMNLEEGGYRHHENGTRGMTTKKAKFYARFFKVPLEWLLDGPRSGHKDPLAHSDEAMAELKIVRDPEAPDPINPDDGAHRGSETGLHGIPEGTIAQLDASGGMGGGGLTIVNEGVVGKSGMTFAAESIRDYWRLPSAILSALGIRNSDAIMLQVKGDSNAPVLLNGDYVLVNTKHRWPSPDGFYALLDDFGEIIVKRLRTAEKDEDGDVLIDIISANPAYPTRSAKAHDLQIIGLVTQRFSSVF